jgi:hypothetical protein
VFRCVNIYLLFGGALLAVNFAPSAGYAWCQMTTEAAQSSNGLPIACATEGVPLQWTQRCTQVAVSMGDELPRDLMSLSETDVHRIVSEAFAVWAASSVNQGIEVEILQATSECQQAEYNQDSGNMNTIVLAGDWNERGYFIDGQFLPYDPAAFAVTTAWHNGTTGEILDVDIEVNEQRGPYVECARSCAQGGCVGETDAQDRQVVDLLNVLTHEVGHYYGLDHTVVDPTDSDDERLATMWAKAPAGEVCKRVLKEDDVEGLRNIYPEEDLQANCEFTPRGGASLICSGAQDGCACDASGSGASNGFMGWLVMAGWLLWARRKVCLNVPR